MNEKTIVASRNPLTMIKDFFKKVWTNKKLRYISLAIIFVLLLVTMKSGGSGVSVSYDTVVKQDLTKTVKASGQVTSVTDLNLSFKTSNIVSSVNVKVGDKVKKGQVLAVLSNQSETGTLTTARGQLLSAKAKYQKLLNSNDNDVVLAEIDVKNAYRKMLSDDLVATPENDNSTQTDPVISGVYNGTKTGRYYIDHYNSVGGFAFYLKSNESDAVENTGTGEGSTFKPTPLGTLGLFIEYGNDWDENPSIETYIVEIPNTKSTSYVANYNAYQTALQNLEIAKQNSKIDSADIDQANADILQAEGAVQVAQGNYDSTVIVAPANGTITKVDVKVGELANALTPVIVLQDVTDLYVEANINESNITNLTLNLPVEYTIDAFGPEKKFSGLLTSIDPSASIESGIVNYKIKASVSDTDPNIKPGMNANLTILISKKEGVLVVPQVAIVNHDNKNFVNIVTNEKRGKYVEKEVSLGSVGDGNLVEITNGLNEGDRIAIVSK